MIPYARPDISESDIQAVVEVLKTDWLTQGPAQEKFEKAMAAYCGVKHAVTVSSATAGLHITYLALGVGREKKVWTTPNTFVATSNAALYCGASVDFVDIDPVSYNLSADRLSDKIEKYKSTLPSVITPVHFSGQSCLMEKIFAIAREHEIAVVEDASHAVGARYLNRPVGCCQFSDAAVFSFHAVKCMTTGEGGMVLTNRTDLYEKLIRLRTHGVTRNPQLLSESDPAPWYYEQIELGLHYRMTDIQAALGASQLSRLDEMVHHRTTVASIYNEALRNLPITLPHQDPSTQSSWHLYVIRLKLYAIKKTHRQIFLDLRNCGIGVNLHYIPVHLQPYYKNLGFKKGDFIESEKYYSEAISLPVYSQLSEPEQQQVIEALKKVLCS